MASMVLRTTDCRPVPPHFNEWSRGCQLQITSNSLHSPQVTFGVVDNGTQYALLSSSISSVTALALRSQSHCMNFTHLTAVLSLNVAEIHISSLSSATPRHLVSWSWSKASSGFKPTLVSPDPCDCRGTRGFFAFSQLSLYN